MTSTMIERRWADLIPAPDKPVFQLLDAQHPFKFYVGREVTGEYLFLLVDAERPPLLKSMRAIRAHSFERTDGQWGLLLKLEHNELAGLFALLCEDLVLTSRGLPSHVSIMKFVGVRLGNWRRLLQNGRELLTASEVRGLFGELAVLEKVFVPTLGSAAAVKAWVGPLGADQDFQSDESAVEVKTIHPGSQTVTISSERQLVSPRSELNLIVVTLSEVDDEREGTTLNELVSRVRLILYDHPLALDAFDEGLALAKYSARNDYDMPVFRISNVTTYGIVDGFPRILPALISPGISAVCYQLELASCEPFKLNNKFVLD